MYEAFAAEIVPGQYVNGLEVLDTRAVGCNDTEIKTSAGPWWRYSNSDVLTVTDAR